MNHPISSNQSSPFIHHEKSAHWAVCWLILSATILVMLSGCGRSNNTRSANATVTELEPERSTPTSVVILASTPTNMPPSSEKNAAGNNSGTSNDINSSSQNATTGDNATNGGNGSSERASASADEEDSEALTCDQDIALDLVGHPQYANLLNELGCPVGSAVLDPVAINEFGSGPDYDRFMLWFSSNKQIYVLKPDQTWEAFQDTWIEGEEAEIHCNPLGGEMTSPPLPRRGFGKLWCADSELQTIMGTVEREERLCQHTVLQEFERGLLLGCFEDATIRYIQLFKDLSWDMRFVQ